MKKNTIGSPINETPQTGAPLVISTGDDLSSLEWTDEKRKELEDALNVIGEHEKAKRYDIDGLQKLSIDSLTESMDNGTTSGWVDIYPEPLTEHDIHEAAKVGNACMEYWMENGKFPKTKDDIEDGL